ncbi:MAG: hypothetical protein HZC17_09960 [Candidatus Omnitrophica bacterium]|nr:hypothetical protein [Candidatus Omnitrophota bacterium]
MKLKTLLIVLAAVVFLNASAFAASEAAPAKGEKPCLIKNMIKALFYKEDQTAQNKTGEPVRQ